MNISQSYDVHGHIRLIKHDGSGVRTTDGEYDADFDNLILNSGLDQLPVYGFSAPILYAQVGTSSTTPTVSQTALISPIASSAGTISNSYTFVASPVPYMQTVRIVRFSVGAAAGNLAEIAMSSDSHTSGVPAYCRALILDSGGSPTVLTVLSTEALDVVYTQRVYLPTNTQTGSVEVDGDDYDFISMLSLVSAEADVDAEAWMAWNWPGGNGGSSMWSAPIYSSISDFGSQTVGITGTSINSASWTDDRASYVGGTFARTANFQSTIETIPTGTVAGGKIRWAVSGPATKVMFTPPIPIDETQSIKFTTKVTFGRYTP